MTRTIVSIVAAVSFLFALSPTCSSFSFPFRGATEWRNTPFRIARGGRHCSLTSHSRIASAFDQRSSLHKHLRFSHSSQSRSLLIRATTSASSPSEESEDEKKSVKRRRTQKLTLASLVLIALAIGGVQNRNAFAQTLASIKPHHLNKWLITWLDHLNDAGTFGLIVYTILFWVWEMTAGITTPVETAAGMAFGVKRGILVNCIGKTGGALTAFLLGRWVFYDSVHKRVKQNEILGLVEGSVKEHPIGVALLCRFSPLPEFVKNFGLSVLELRARYFLLAVILHGLPFTCLWTCLGAETARVMRGGVASTTLKYLVTGVSWFGLVVSPTLIGFWVKSLKDKQRHLHEHDDSEENIP